jgi:hypothetical protein
MYLAQHDVAQFDQVRQVCVGGKGGIQADQHLNRSRQRSVIGLQAEQPGPQRGELLLHPLNALDQPCRATTQARKLLVVLPLSIVDNSAPRS